MATKFCEAPGMRSLGLELMEEFHSHLIGNAVEVRFLYQDTIIKEGGREIVCATQKISGLAAYLASGGEFEEDYQTKAQRRGVEDEIHRMSEEGEGDEEEDGEADPTDTIPDVCPLFVIRAHKATWEALPRERQAMELDRALKRCDSHTDDDGRVVISKRPYEVCDFADIVRRYAAYMTDDMKRYIMAGNQMAMVLDGAEADKKASEIMEQAAKENAKESRRKKADLTIVGAVPN